jgi:hypothetical protein
VDPPESTEQLVHDLLRKCALRSLPEHTLIVARDVAGPSVSQDDMGQLRQSHAADTL